MFSVPGITEVPLSFRDHGIHDRCEHLVNPCKAALIYMKACGASIVRAAVIAAGMLALTAPAYCTVYTYAAPGDFADSTTYAVSADGTSIQVKAAPTCDPNNPNGVQSQDYTKPVAEFGFDGSVNVSVTPSFSWSSCRVMPNEYGVSVSTSGNTANFTLTDNTKGKVVVEFDNDLSKCLFLFADPPLPAVPSGARVISQNSGSDISVGDGETVYIDPGVVVYGSLNIKNVNNAHVMGRGWVLGSLWVDTTNNCSLDGIHMGANGLWAINILNSSYFTITDLKTMFLSSQTDGLSWNNTNHSSCSNSFLMQGDDVFTAQQLGCHDNLTQNVVVWSQGGNLFAPGASGDMGGNNVYNDIYFVKTNYTNFFTHHWSGGPGNIAGFTFQNVFVDSQSRLQSFIYIGPENTSSGTRYYTFRNVHLVAAPSTVDFSDAHFTFDGLYMNGALMTNTGQMNLTDNGSNNTFTFLNGTIADGNYKIAAKTTGNVLDCSGCGNGNGNPIQLWSPSNCPFQVWNVHNNGDGTYAIRNVNADGTLGRSLDCSGCSPEDQTSLQLYDYWGGPCQQWIITEQADGYYSIATNNAKSDGTHDVIDGAGCSGAVGTHMMLWVWDGYPNPCQQEWAFLAQ